MLVAIAVGFSILVALLIIVAAKSPAENYTDSARPIYTGSYANEPQAFNGSLKVVSWNLNFATRVDQAINEFQTVDELRDADIILLQEMDEHSIEKVAQALEYNYIFYPAAIHRRHNRQFGNAILSTWPLSSPKKIILSQSFAGLKHNRIAARVLVNLGDQQVVAYSAHLDMVWMLPGQNRTQVDVLVDQVAGEEYPAIVGGDFNSWSAGSIQILEERFGEIGLERVSQGTGPTIKTYGGLKLTLDHIFASLIFESQAGVWQNTAISDHAAVWTILSINGNQ
jgi:endonuclease/exonuclease/phosphatase family metal-dependent hydrolase